MPLHPSLLIAVGLTVVFLSCADEQTAATGTTARPVPLDEALIGTWETVELDIQYASFQGGDTAYTETIKEADWGRKYGVRPPSTVFTPDGKLRRTHRLRDGEIANITNGIWRAQGDSLLIIEPNVTLTYYPDLVDDRLQLTGVNDQDRDGQRDDHYRAVYRLVSRTR